MGRRQGRRREIGPYRFGQGHSCCDGHGGAGARPAVTHQTVMQLFERRGHLQFLTGTSSHLGFQSEKLPALQGLSAISRQGLRNESLQGRFVEQIQAGGQPLQIGLDEQVIDLHQARQGGRLPGSPGGWQSQNRPRQGVGQLTGAVIAQPVAMQGDQQLQKCPGRVWIVLGQQGTQCFQGGVQGIDPLADHGRHGPLEKCQQTGILALDHRHQMLGHDPGQGGAVLGSRCHPTAIVGQIRFGDRSHQAGHSQGQGLAVMNLHGQGLQGGFFQLGCRVRGEPIVFAIQTAGNATGQARIETVQSLERFRCDGAHHSYPSFIPAPTRTDCQPV